MKKIIPLICLLLIGCTAQSKVINKANGDSKTYNTFKNIDENNYCLELFDRNTNKNDSTKIIIAKKNSEYLYEIKGTIKQTTIQKNGYKYVFDNIQKTYTKEKINKQFDNSIRLIPKNINKLKTAGYETGKTKIFNKNLIYEKYVNKAEETTYYFNANKLIYIRYKTFDKILLYRFDKLSKPKSSMFKLKNYQLITY
ncbi:MAG: hypothetical protein PUA73_01290 [Bacilli bacterium]|nr:hypothetical protein [Bacilli bacterium]